ncbi:MAG: hypothetical protein A2341_06500 [Deltaproteobacteria bacterium RIFOXYB12_FULL_58_9]|nr:MAG: hypothetical protein A2341_06500 [Deltaproteobacteria bacterium RIFOXYB12_FULL_58_9]
MLASLLSFAVLGGCSSNLECDGPDQCKNGYRCYEGRCVDDEHCGDFVVDAGEACDDGYTDACGSCNADCTGCGTGLGTCGDGTWCPENNETCDDGYTDACGSCNADCTDVGTGGLTCGDGISCPENNEACDDNNTIPGDGCNTVCLEDPGCGDATCNINGPRFPVSGTQVFDRSTGTEPVVNDSLTGLVWQGCPAGLSGSSCETGVADNDRKTWADALAYCWDLTWNGLDDWYLPDEYELQSLVDYSVHNPAINTTAFPGNPLYSFWTSSSHTGGPGGDELGWLVCFYNGNTGYYLKTSPYNVRCVRGGPIEPLALWRFERTETSEPVVSDGVTGLVWQGCAAGLSSETCGDGSATEKTWADAVSYCDDLTWAGLDDWYLPDPKELRSIADNQRYEPAIDTTAFPATPSSYFWTSSYAGDTTFAWIVGFSRGEAFTLDKTNTFFVRCVRGGP